MTVLGNNEHIIKKKNVDYYGCLKDPFVVFQPLQSGKGVGKKSAARYLDDKKKQPKKKWNSSRTWNNSLLVPKRRV